MTKVIETKNLTKSFGSFTAVDNLSFSIEEGKITALLGPNGAGKTTTIQMLLDIITPTSGDIKIFGKKYSKDKEAILSNINFSSPYVALPSNLTVMENLLTFARLYGVKNPKKKILELVDFFEISDLLNRLTASLSTGQLTRVNLTKAFINDPKLLLLDEATSALDSEVETVIQASLYNLMQGKTVVAIAHRLSTIAAMDRLIVLDKGNIIEEGSHAELLKLGGLYASLWTHQSGGFLGEV